MNSQKLNGRLQITGLFGVIASLVFVGLQLQQTQAIALSETYQDRTAASITMNASILGSSDTLSGIAKIYRNEFDNLTLPEAIALEYVVGSTLLIIENNHIQYLAGFLPEEHWQGNLADIRCILTVPLFRDVAQAWTFRQSFDQVIAAALKEVPIGAENCWSYDWNYPMQ